MTDNDLCPCKNIQTLDAGHRGYLGWKIDGSAPGSDSIMRREVAVKRLPTWMFIGAPCQLEGMVTQDRNFAAAKRTGVSTGLL